MNPRMPVAGAAVCAVALSLAACTDDVATSSNRDGGVATIDDASPREADASEREASVPEGGLAKAPCSDGIARDPKVLLPRVTFEVPAPVAQCEPRCGAALLPIGKYSVADLPGGACTNDGHVCTLGAIRTCPNGSLGPSDRYACLCTGGVWDCGLYEGLGGACGPTDAGRAGDGAAP